MSWGAVGRVPWLGAGCLLDRAGVAATAVAAGCGRVEPDEYPGVLLNPRIAGPSAYHGEIVGQGEWEPLVPEETWRAVRAILEDPARKPPRGVRTLLGGIALCRCASVVTGMPSHTAHRIYRCTPVGRDRAYPGGHVARQASTRRLTQVRARLCSWTS